MSRDINQVGLLDTKKLEETSFVVVGAGAIGSFVTMTLSKMGAKLITVYDDDSIELHNVNNQLYPVRYVGTDKVDALENVAFAFGECKITKIKARWTHENAVDADVVVSAVDNMDTRIAMWKHYCMDGKTKFFLDGRMGAQVYYVYGVDLKDAKAVVMYSGSLYPQSEAVPDRCGQKSIIYTVLQVSAQMLSQTKRWIMGEYRPTEVIYDALHDEITKRYTMERDLSKLEVMEEVEA